MSAPGVGRREYPGGGVFEAVVGDLLTQPVDAIVNAANGRLAHGGGVAAAISRAAGREMDEEGFRLVRERGPVPTGEAVVTGAGRLPFRGVIHAVGPAVAPGGGYGGQARDVTGGGYGGQARDVTGGGYGGQARDVTGGGFGGQARDGGGDQAVQELLTSALFNSFRLAHERGWGSLAFPAVSSGIFAVPHNICARAYLAAPERFFARHPASPLKRLRLVLRPGPLAELVAGLFLTPR